jgi:hypothetical protein
MLVFPVMGDTEWITRGIFISHAAGSEALTKPVRRGHTPHG